MKINILSEHGNGFVRDALLLAIRESRFTADIELTGYGNKLNISKVRLMSSKQYCGNHPSACENPNQRHRKGTYLEGADWVEFNDLLNDVLDKLKVSANVASTICVVRKDVRRRIRYNNGERFPNGTWQWLKDESDDGYEDHTESPASDSWFPEGTPGQYKQHYFVVG